MARIEENKVYEPVVEEQSELISQPQQEEQQD